jgi:hypothetical protein
MPGHPRDAAVGTGVDLQVHPVLTVLSGVERPVRGGPVGGNQGPVQDHVGVPSPHRVPDQPVPFYPDRGTRRSCQLAKNG